MQSPLGCAAPPPAGAFDESQGSIPLKVDKSLFPREMSWISSEHPGPCAGRGVAGHPRATGNGAGARVAPDGNAWLEHASEEAGAAAQQAAEEPAEPEDASADGRAAEAALAADVGLGQDVGDRADDLQRTVVGLCGEAAHDVT